YDDELLLRIGLGQKALDRALRQGGPAFGDHHAGDTRLPPPRQHLMMRWVKGPGQQQLALGGEPQREGRYRRCNFLVHLDIAHVDADSLVPGRVRSYMQPADTSS